MMKPIRFPYALRIVGALTAFAIFLLQSCKKPNEPEAPNGELPAPVIHSFAPASGPVGTTVVISGNHFGADPMAVSVKFNGTGAGIVSINAASITVAVPTGATTGKISVSRSGTEVLSTSMFTVSGVATDPDNPVAAWKVSHFSGSGTTGSADGPAHAASFHSPRGMAVDAAGNLYVADTWAHKIRKVTPQGAVSTIAGTGVRGMANGDALTQASFNMPLSIALDAAGNLYVADGGNHAVRKITPAGVVSTVAGNGTPGYVDGAAAAARFSTPYGIAVDDVGNIYVGDHANHRIRKITPGGRVNTIAGNGTQTSTDGLGTSAGIPWPGGLVLDEEGTLYVGEKGAGRIRKIALTGAVTTLGGYLSVNTGPSHLAVDKDKNVYVLYRGMNRLRKYAPGGVETEIAGTYDPGDAHGSPGRFRHPEGLAMMQDAQGRITFFVSDTENKKIKKVTFE